MPVPYHQVLPPRRPGRADDDPCEQHHEQDSQHAQRLRPEQAEVGGFPRVQGPHEHGDGAGRFFLRGGARFVLEGHRPRYALGRAPGVRGRHREREH